jgi:GT2 family glycosyltransferase
VEPGFIEPLVKKLEDNPEIGIVSPKIRYFSNPDKIQYAGFTSINPFTIRNFSVGFNETDQGQYDKDSITNYAFGAAMMLPVHTAKEVGLMADIFFLYYEELDWIQRIKDAGYQVWYIHNSLVYHKDSISTGSMSPLKIYYLSRNRILYMRRNIKGWTSVISFFYQLFIAIPKNAGLFLLKGQFGLFSAYIRALGWHIKTMFNKDIHKSPGLS